jgi:hypothetical protein
MRHERRLPFPKGRRTKKQISSSGVDRAVEADELPLPCRLHRAVRARCSRAALARAAEDEVDSTR